MLRIRKRNFKNTKFFEIGQIQAGSGAKLSGSGTKFSGSTTLTIYELRLPPHLLG